MAVNSLSVEDFIFQSAYFPILDVRSPGEYNHAHIPGAVSFPLFSDEERAIVGTTYKQQNREDAIKIGLDIFGPKMRKMVEQAEMICNNQSESLPKTILIHCWRGGMRSGGVAWLLDLYGFRVYILKDGYKAYRNWVLGHFTRIYSFKILGGNTGSGKTYLLHELEKKGELVIDLEGLANHKGSAFGNIGMPQQPTQEMFENLLAMDLFQKGAQSKDIWIEDESQRLGHVNVPVQLWKFMAICPVYFLEIPFEERLNFIVEEYGKLDKERLVNGVIRIKKRLGGLETKNAINYLIEDNIKESFRILLKYYDKSYTKSLHKKENLQTMLHIISCKEINQLQNAMSVIKLVSDI